MEEGETPFDAAVREVREEIGITIKKDALQPVARIDFLFPDRPEWSQRVYYFLYRGEIGEPIESDEAKPCWFNLEDLPLDKMWDDAKYWLPEVLEKGKRIEGEFTFRSDEAGVLRVREWDIRTLTSSKEWETTRWSGMPEHDT